MSLDRELVVRTALALLDEVGLDGLTLRRIATELKVSAPTLYWHVASKQELLDEMATTMLRDLLASAPSPSGSWPQWLLDTGHALRGMLLSHRDGAKMFSGTYLTDDSLLASMETPLRILTDAGFSLEQAVSGWSTIYSYAIGFTIEEQAVHPRPDARDPRYELDKRERRIDAARFPLTAAAGPDLLTGFDERFERGMRLIVAGLTRTLDRPRSQGEAAAPT